MLCRSGGDASDRKGSIQTRTRPGNDLQTGETRGNPGMAYTAHVDTFTRDSLPPRDQWPAFLFNRPELQYPERLNCVVPFLDQWVRDGRGDEPCLISPAETLCYREL